MGNIFLTRLKVLLRNKANTFWILLFPIILGCLFKVAFSNLAEAENRSVIPVAVVLSEDAYGDSFKESLDSLSDPDSDDAMLKVTYCDQNEAMDLLEEKEVTGILTSGETVSLTVSSNMTQESLNQSILKAFVNEYNMYQDAIMKIAVSHPEKLADIMENFASSSDYNSTKELSRNQNANPFDQYFFNLLAMTCLYTAIGGVAIATGNKANISDLAMRKCIAPTHKLVTLVGEMIATTIYEFALNLVGFMFMAFILKVDVLSRAPLAILTIFVGCMLGVSLGLLIGCLGTASKEIKSGMVFAVTMPLCFLSGLTFANMKIIIQNHCPIVNKLNPACLITDAFYSLAVYEGFSRFLTDLAIMILYVIAFCFIGYMSTRREKYASL